MSAEIRRLLQQLTKTAKLYADAVVVSVDETNRSAVVELLGEHPVEIPVRLMAAVDDGVLVLPEVDSTVIVALADEPYIAMFSGVEKIILRGGQFDGLVKVADLVTKLNNLENKVNDLVSKFNAHTHVLTLSTGTGTAAPTVAPVAGTLTPTQQTDLENENITHG
jgi:hypothetical protein